MHIIAFLLQGAALGLTASASPGPLQTYLVNQTLTGGWRRGVPVAFAPLISDPPVIFLILLLLNQIPVLFFNIISLAGGLFVLYLAWGLWRQWKRDAPRKSETGITTSECEKIDTPNQNSPVENQKTNSQTSLGILLRGVVLSLLSPGMYAFWTLVNGPILLSALEDSVLLGAAFLIGFYTFFIGGMLGIVMIFHFARRLGPRVVHILTLVSILILVVFGAILIGRAVI